MIVFLSPVKLLQGLWSFTSSTSGYHITYTTYLHPPVIGIVINREEKCHLHPNTMSHVLGSNVLIFVSPRKKHIGEELERAERGEQPVEVVEVGVVQII